MAKPCRNSRWFGPPKEFSVTTPDGVPHTIIERPFELLPDYGRASLHARTINGFNPDMQTGPVRIEFHHADA